MAGFRLTNGTAGCPPTEDPPAGYTIPFRFDSGGRLWINLDPSSFKFVGVARHDIAVNTPFGPTSGMPDGGFVTTGVQTNLTVTNTTPNTLGYLLAYDLFADFDVTAASYASIVLFGTWNTVSQSNIAVTSIRMTAQTDFIRVQSSTAANAHDIAIEAGLPASLTVAPGASATIGAKLYSDFIEGTPNGFDGVHQVGSAVRVYSYVL